MFLHCLQQSSSKHVILFTSEIFQLPQEFSISSNEFDLIMLKRVQFTTTQLFSVFTYLSPLVLDLSTGMPSLLNFEKRILIVGNGSLYADIPVSNLRQSQSARIVILCCLSTLNMESSFSMGRQFVSFVQRREMSSKFQIHPSQNAEPHMVLAMFDLEMPCVKPQIIRVSF